MNAILLTVFVGVVLVSLFVVMFLRYRKDATGSSPERDSLLPFEDEFQVPSGPARPPKAASTGVKPSR